MDILALLYFSLSTQQPGRQSNQFRGYRGSRASAPARGQGRFAANARLRQPQHPTPQYRHQNPSPHIANLATSNAPTTSTSDDDPTQQSSAYEWTEHDAEQYDNLHNAFMAARERALDSAIAADPVPDDNADEEIFYSAPLTGTKRGHDYK